MELCTACGARLGPGRACAACGHPVQALDLSDWRTDTAERPAVGAVPPAARFPLYADDAPPAATPGSRRPRHDHAWLPRSAGAAALVLVAAVGAALALGSPGAAEDRPAPAAADARTSGPSGSGSTPRSTPAPQPTRVAGAEPSRALEPRGPEDVTAAARVSVPATAPPSRSLDGTRTAYHAGNLLDGDRSTAWRMRGDGTGIELVVRLDRPTTVTRVGLVNGYAKQARGARGGVLDWYTGNRRVLAVEWVLDDGTVVQQRLAETRRLQTAEVGAITTRRLRVRLVEVSPPGAGRAGRDHTALSELSVVGLPG